VHDAQPAEAADAHVHQHAAVGDQPSDGPNHSSGCTCVGVCSVTSASHPTTFAVRPILTVTVVVRLVQVPARLVLPGQPEFFLPFASGPPQQLHTA
jgi:hypothetical protein